MFVEDTTVESSVKKLNSTMSTLMRGQMVILQGIADSLKQNDDTIAGIARDIRRYIGKSRSPQDTILDHVREMTADLQSFIIYIKEIASLAGDAYANILHSDPLTGRSISVWVEDPVRLEEHSSFLKSQK